MEQTVGLLIVLQTTAPMNASSTNAIVAPAPHNKATEEEDAGGRSAKSNHDRVFELEGEARTNRFSAFSADVNITCWGLRNRLLRELLGVLLQQDHTQTGFALPLCMWRETWFHPGEKNRL